MLQLTGREFIRIGSAVWMVVWMVVLLASVESLAASNTNPSRADVYRMYLRDRDGISANPAVFQAEFPKYEELVRQFQIKNNEIKERASESCLLFISTFEDANRQSMDAFRELKKYAAPEFPLNATTINRVARLQLLEPFVQGLAFMLANDFEAGVGLLDPEHEKTQCAVANRAAWKKNSDDLLFSSLKLMVALLGDPGTEAMRKTRTALESSVIHTEAYDYKLFLGSIAGGAAVSIATFSLVPIFGAALFGVEAMASLGPYALYGLRFASTLTEQFAYKTAQKDFLFREDAEMESEVGVLQWRDFFQNAQSFLSLPLNSPRFYARI